MANHHGITQSRDELQLNGRGISLGLGVVTLQQVQLQLATRLKRISPTMRASRGGGEEERRLVCTATGLKGRSIIWTLGGDGTRGGRSTRLGCHQVRRVLQRLSMCRKHMACPWPRNADFVLAHDRAALRSHIPPATTPRQQQPCNQILLSRIFFLVHIRIDFCPRDRKPKLWAIYIVICTLFLWLVLQTLAQAKFSSSISFIVLGLAKCIWA